MYKLAVRGKDGVGKPTVSANISHLLSSGGRTVLHVECDPKRDSTAPSPMASPTDVHIRRLPRSHTHLFRLPVMRRMWRSRARGRMHRQGHEILLDRISGVDADYRVCDILGDIVYGGFSVPTRKGNADGTVLVTSEEFMSLFATNNILRGLCNIDPGRGVLGSFSITGSTRGKRT